MQIGASLPVSRSLYGLTIFHLAHQTQSQIRRARRRKENVRQEERITGSGMYIALEAEEVINCSPKTITLLAIKSRGTKGDVYYLEKAACLGGSYLGGDDDAREKEGNGRQDVGMHVATLLSSPEWWLRRGRKEGPRRGSAEGAVKPNCGKVVKEGRRRPIRDAVRSPFDKHINGTEQELGTSR